MKKSFVIIFLISLVLFSCKKKAIEPVKPSYKITINTQSDTTTLIPVILTNGLDYFKKDTFDLREGKIDYSGISDSVMQLIVRFPKKDINLYIASGDTINVTYFDDLIKVSGDSVNTRLYEFYRSNIYYINSLNNLKDTLSNYLNNDSYKKLRIEWRNKISNYISKAPNNLTSPIILKENMQYYDDVNSITTLNKSIKENIPIINRVIEQYTDLNKRPNINFKIASFALRTEYKKTEQLKKIKKTFNIFDNNNSNNIITFWSYNDSLSVKRVKELNAIEKKYKNKNLKFITISLDVDTTTWKKKVDEYKIPGRNFILTKGLGYDLAKRLNVNTIPANIITNTSLIIKGYDMFDKQLDNYLKENIKTQTKNRSKQ